MKVLRRSRHIECQAGNPAERNRLRVRGRVWREQNGGRPMKTWNRSLAVLGACMVAMFLLPATSSAQGVLFVQDNMVGIGTDTPAYPLHVVASDGSAQIRVEETNGTAAARSLFWLRNNGGSRFAMQNTDTGRIWQFNALGNFNIDFNGNAGNEFQVQGDGDIIAGGRVFANGGSDVFPDYVFDEGYELMSLTDLNSYIEQNRHLPNIPSADQIAALGSIDMT